MSRLLLCIVATGLLMFAAVPAVFAEGDWKAEFDAVCGQTDNAADMTVDDLKKAIGRCDLLKPKVEALEASPRKVYLKRLQMCRNLFVYLLEGKERS